MTPAIEQLARHRPKSWEDLLLLVHTAHELQTPLFPVGAESAFFTGRQLPFAPLKGMLVDMTAFDRIIDYPAEEMTVTVQAGITKATLDRILATKGQQLPIDVADPDRATLGGMIACNASGPRRFGYGTLRDYLLGIDFASAEGERIHGGGRVVKNVAGYDLMRLQIGALGTLGLIAEVTLKLQPLFPDRRALWIANTDLPLAECLDALNETATRPVAIELVDHAAATTLELPWPRDSSWGVLVYFEAPCDTNQWQAEQLVQEMKSLSLPTTVIEPSLAATLPQRLCAWRDLEGTADNDSLVKVTVLPSDLPSLANGIKERWPQAELTAHAGNGIAWVKFPGCWENVGDDGKDFSRLLARYEHSRIEILRTPGSGEPKQFPTGRPCIPPPAWKMMKELKRSLDPSDLFNPRTLFGSSVDG